MAGIHMPAGTTQTKIMNALDNMSPAAAHAALGTTSYMMWKNWNAFLLKLDTANLTGMSNTNSASFAVILPETRR